MPVSDYDASPNKNTAISGINIAEGCPPGNVNDAIRQMMADIKIMSAEPLPDATTSAKGVVMLAETSDTTSTTKSATPAGVKAAVDAALDTMDAALAEHTPDRGFTQSLADNGWAKLPNGLILQWGRSISGSRLAEGAHSIAFPIAFPSACYMAMGTIANTEKNGFYDFDCQTVTFTTTTAAFWLQAMYAPGGEYTTIHPYGFYWFAIGK